MSAHRFDGAARRLGYALMLMLTVQLVGGCPTTPVDNDNTNPGSRSPTLKRRPSAGPLPAPCVTMS